MPGIENEMHLVDNVIDTKLLPALLDGRSLSLNDRKLLSLPTRLGGLSIPIFSDFCTVENENSKTICQDLTSNIVSQNNTTVISRKEPSNIHQLRYQISNEREQSYRTLLNHLRSSMTAEQIRANDLAQLKGSSTWLTTLPLAREGYILNKREFYDAIFAHLSAISVAVETSSDLLRLWKVFHSGSCLIMLERRFYPSKT